MSLSQLFFKNVESNQAYQTVTFKTLDTGNLFVSETNSACLLMKTGQNRAIRLWNGLSYRVGEEDIVIPCCGNLTWVRNRKNMKEVGDG